MPGPGGGCDFTVTFSCNKFTPYEKRSKRNLLLIYRCVQGSSVGVAGGLESRGEGGLPGSGGGAGLHSTVIYSCNKFIPYERPSKINLLLICRLVQWASG